MCDELGVRFGLETFEKTIHIRESERNNFKLVDFLYCKSDLYEFSQRIHLGNLG